MRIILDTLTNSSSNSQPEVSEYPRNIQLANIVCIVGGRSSLALAYATKSQILKTGGNLLLAVNFNSDTARSITKSSTTTT